MMVSAAPRTLAGFVLTGTPVNTILQLKGAEPAQRKPAGRGSRAKSTKVPPVPGVRHRSMPFVMAPPPARAGTASSKARPVRMATCDDNLRMNMRPFPPSGMESFGRDENVFSRLRGRRSNRGFVFGGRSRLWSHRDLSAVWPRAEPGDRGHHDPGFRGSLRHQSNRRYSAEVVEAARGKAPPAFGAGSICPWTTKAPALRSLTPYPLSVTGEGESEKNQCPPGPLMLRCRLDKKEARYATSFDRAVARLAAGGRLRSERAGAGRRGCGGARQAERHSERDRHGAEPSIGPAERRSPVETRAVEREPGRGPRAAIAERAGRAE